MFQSGQVKITKYYELTDSSPAYACALVLNPRWKWRYIEGKWEKSWHESAIKAVKKVQETEYRLAVLPPPRRTTLTNDFFTSLKADFPAQIKDEYTRYCSAPWVDTSDAISWWLQEQQQKDYPNLGRMALDFLSILGMSAEPERLFSSTKITINDLRSRLGSDTMEALECLRLQLKIKDSKIKALIRLATKIREDKDNVDNTGVKKEVT